MKPVYEIKFLGSKDFDKLPKSETAGSDISDSMGFYNPHTNRVFIRHTAIPELDKYLLEHEFDHLLEKEATDEDENGIRHKKKGGFGQFLRVLVNPTNTRGAIGLGTADRSKGSFGIGKPTDTSGGAKLGNAFSGNWLVGGSLQKQQKAQEEAEANARLEAEDRSKMEQFYSSFGGYGQNQGGEGKQAFASSTSPLSGQNSTGPGLNQGLNQQSINPLSDPYARYGQQAGRTYNF